MTERHGERRAVPIDEPAPVITSKARTATWDQVEYVNGNQPNSAIRGGLAQRRPSCSDTGATT